MRLLSLLEFEFSILQFTPFFLRILFLRINNPIFDFIFTCTCTFNDLNENVISGSVNVEFTELNLEDENRLLCLSTGFLNIKSLCVLCPYMSVSVFDCVGVFLSM